MSRQSATAYARSLEQQVAELQRQVNTLANPSSDALDDLSTRTSPESQQEHVDLLLVPGNNLVLDQDHGKKVYSSSAALNVLRTIVDMLGSGNAASKSGQALVQALESSIELPVKTSMDWLKVLLPDKEEIWRKINYAIENALMCHDCINRDSIRARLVAMSNPMTSSAPATRTSFLALIYGLLALSQLYDEGHPDDSTTQRLEPPGLIYFRASRCIVHEEHEPADLDSVIAMWLHSRYLLSVSSFSDAHAALTVAISAAMHMGLHLHDTSLKGSFTEHELYQRRRVFAVLNAVEITIAFPLGVPRILRTADRRQTLGLSSNHLLNAGVTLIAQDPTTSEAETILHQKLQMIYAKILDHQSEQTINSYPNIDWMSDIELELQDWERSLPSLATEFPSTRILKGQLNLRLYYAAAHILLYAPCLHHLGRQKTDAAWSIRGYEYGSTCLRAASQAVFLMDTLNAHRLLNRTHWANTYILAWTATILAYFVINSPTRVTITESKQAALKAFEMLKYVGATNLAARGVCECIALYMQKVSTMDD